MESSWKIHASIAYILRVHCVLVHKTKCTNTTDLLTYLRCPLSLFQTTQESLNAVIKDAQLSQHSFVFEMMHNDDVLVLEVICLSNIIGANALAVFEHESKL